MVWVGFDGVLQTSLRPVPVIVSPEPIRAGIYSSLGVGCGDVSWSGHWVYRNAAVLLRWGEYHLSWCLLRWLICGAFIDEVVGPHQRDYYPALV